VALVVNASTNHQSQHPCGHELIAADMGRHPPEPLGNQHPGNSTLMVDPPGSGEALRLQGLTSRVDSEAWATACVDYLELATTSTQRGWGWSAGR